MHAPDASSARSLQAQGIGVAFAGLRALHGVNLALRPGQVLGLIGPNGAGKTTMVNVLTGFQAPTQGQVVLNGQVMNGRGAHTFRRQGIARTFQAGRLFKDLSVLDNLAVTGVALGASRPEAEQQAWHLLERLKLTPLAPRGAGALPYTDERRVAIARALMRSPQYLLLDEPAAGMSEHEASDLAANVRDMARELNCGVLLIEHNVRMVLETCEYIVVLDSGEVIEKGTPEAIRHSAVVRHAYMGTTADVPEEAEAVLG
ncbi:ABC transporter ATP-binding protein [Ottowia testudinis]|uniref:ABC transporter ATP-binding protein n=1 Tax=Ottowia testudinis TaxID=2816950 RepID=A0A975H3N5_9BURK|nr:ABC transporter ATP-binding protein [Ottowia testudinis]QTD46009.1 ABC transporter ATP-binding protein [Ottowia testudinis]